MDRICEFRPFPGSGAYGHWTCERPLFHLGRHRFRNYTVARIPRVWRLRRIVRRARLDREHYLRFGKTGFGYRRILFPTKYEPVKR